MTTTKRDYDRPTSRMTTARVPVDVLDRANAVRSSGEPLSDLLAEGWDRVVKFRTNGQKRALRAKVVGVNGDGRKVVDDGGPLMVDGIDGEIVRGEP